MYENQRWYALNVNPEPWAVGPLDLIRRGGKLAPTMGRNQQLHMYQQAIKDELYSKYGAYDGAPLAPSYALSFFFWRNTLRANIADATNLMKATEDALQGILLTNDREVIRNRSEIVQQSPEVNGAVAFCIQWGLSKIGTLSNGIRVSLPGEPPEEILSEIAMFHHGTPDMSDNSWPPRTS